MLDYPEAASPHTTQLRTSSKPLNDPAIRVYPVYMAEQWIEASLALDLVGSSESIL